MSETQDGEGRLEKIARVAKMAGTSVATPMIQSFLREKVVEVLSNHDPEKLERYIHVNYDLVGEELPDEYKNVLGSIGPQFGPQIKAMVKPQTVMYWLEKPEEWMDAEENPQRAREIRECADIIKNTPGGEEWLAQECLQLYKICGII